MAKEPISYDKGDLRAILRAFKAMDEQATLEARKVSGELAAYAGQKIQQKASTRIVAAEAVQRVADGLKVSKSSKIGEISIGFRSQRFSGGATTQDLWPGLEFGSNRFKQFPNRTPRKGKGNVGYFIFPTLAEIQPYIVREWENAFTRILDEWGK